MNRKSSVGANPHDKEKIDSIPKPKRHSMVSSPNKKTSDTKTNTIKRDTLVFKSFNLNESNNTNNKDNNSTAENIEPDEENSSNIKVICRFRPLNEKEILIRENEKKVDNDGFNSLCVRFLDPTELEIKSSAESNNKYKFKFDRIFDTQSAQSSIYDFSAKPIVSSVLEGFNGTIFAYGQTGSGKTHTMSGAFENVSEQGIIPRTVNQIFNTIISSPEEIEFTVKVAMIEIYMEKIRDLIDTSKSNLNVREDKYNKVFIEGLTEVYVGSPEEILELMKIGTENRTVCKTNMNDTSSRSHSIVIITISQNDTKNQSAKSGKLFLVDLAGSEKISKTLATGTTLDEAKMINKSLTTLGMVINSLTDGKSGHIPYRESKLTRILSESLGGNAKTTLIITCSPSPYNESESLSTLRFGMRAKKIKNKPKINKELTVAELKVITEKLEKALKLSNIRINQLEKIIKEKGLEIPLTLAEKVEKVEITERIDKNLNITEDKDDRENYAQSTTQSCNQSFNLPNEDLSLIDSQGVPVIGFFNDNTNRVDPSKKISTNIDNENDNEDDTYFEALYIKLSQKYNELLIRNSEIEESKNFLFDKLQDTLEEINSIKLAEEIKEISVRSKINYKHDQNLKTEKLSLSLNSKYESDNHVSLVYFKSSYSNSSSIEMIECEINEIREHDNDYFYFFLKNKNNDEDVQILSMEDFLESCRICSQNSSSSDYSIVSNYNEILTSKKDTFYNGRFFSIPRNIEEAEDEEMELDENGKKVCGYTYETTNKEKFLLHGYIKKKEANKVNKINNQNKQENKESNFQVESSTFELCINNNTKKPDKMFKENVLVQVYNTNVNIYNEDSISKQLNFSSTQNISNMTNLSNISNSNNFVLGNIISTSQSFSLFSCIRNNVEFKKEITDKIGNIENIENISKNSVYIYSTTNENHNNKILMYKEINGIKYYFDNGLENSNISDNNFKENYEEFLKSVKLNLLKSVKSEVNLEIFSFNFKMDVIKKKQIFSRVKEEISFFVANTRQIFSNLKESQFEVNYQISKKTSTINLNNTVNLNNTPNIMDEQTFIYNEKINKLKEEKDQLKKDIIKFDNEKRLILKSLDEKNDKNKALLAELKDYKDKLKVIEVNLNLEEKIQLKKIINLEKSLDQVNILYHQADLQKSALKIENINFKNKIKKRDEKILILQKEIEDIKEEIKTVQEKLILSAKSSKPSGCSNIVKVIRGSGSSNLHCILENSNSQFTTPSKQISSSSKGDNNYDLKTPELTTLPDPDNQI